MKSSRVTSAFTERTLEANVRRTEDLSARALVHAAGLDAHEAVLDDIYAPHAMSAADAVQVEVDV